MQGYGILGSHPPPFKLFELAAALAFYHEHGYVVVESLTPAEVPAPYARARFLLPTAEIALPG